MDRLIVQHNVSVVRLLQKEHLSAKKDYMHELELAKSNPSPVSFYHCALRYRILKYSVPYNFLRTFQQRHVIAKERVVALRALRWS